MSRTHKCTPATITGRLRKAEMFRGAASDVMDLADDEQDVLDACITLWVTRGSPPPTRCAAGGWASTRRVRTTTRRWRCWRRFDKDRGKDLGVLLALKTPASYGAGRSTAAEAKRARRAAERLVEATRTTA